jgi:CBS domain-containing protein/hemerythrin-like domain-containing protein
MPTLRSCDELRREHELIGQVVQGLETLARRRREGVEIPVLPVVAALDFFTGYVTRCHDAKEVEALFPALAACGAPDGGLVDALGAEREKGRRLLEALRPLSGRRRIDGATWGLLETYLALLRTHIATEDATLLPLADTALSAEDDAALQRAFVAIEERALGREGPAALFALAQAVAQASEALAAAPRGTGSHVVARAVMRPRPGKVAPEDNLARAARVMEAVGAREVPVVAGGSVVGILTRTDMEPHRGHYEWTSVRAAMTPDPVCVAAETPAEDVAGLLLGRGFNAVPVTEDGALLGMVSRADLLRAFAKDGGERA